EDFVGELKLIAESLRASGLDGVSSFGKLHHLLVRAETFGFHMAALDIRQHSGVHENTVAELLSVAAVTDRYPDLSEVEKLVLCDKELKNPGPLSPVRVHFRDESTQILQSFTLIDDMLA